LYASAGNVEDSVWSCGPVIELIDDIPTCQELIDTIVADAERIIKDLPTRLS
jgi:nitronate monooxygenase